jgi:4,5-DOPA dioxygenase extradiol
MNAIVASRYTDAWRMLAAQLPAPRAVLCVSAHWYRRGTAVTAMTQPRTIHDFYGFPPALFACRYPAPGDPVLAARVQVLLRPTKVFADHDWGLDHGTWSVLKYLLPEATTPVLQLSINSELTFAEHYALAQRLAPLRAEGVLILGSGNIVHNLSRMQRDPNATGYAWANEFNQAVRTAIEARDHQSLQDLAQYGSAASYSVPTPEHYLPLLYVLAQQRDDETVTIPVDGVDMGSISMLCTVVGNLALASGKCDDGE